MSSTLLRLVWTLAAALLVTVACDEAGPANQQPDDTSTGGQSPNGGEDGTACFDCLENVFGGQCQKFYESCFGQSACQDWVDCTALCATESAESNTHDCYLGCDEEYLASNSANQNLKSCSCDGACESVCTSFCTCQFDIQ